MGKTQPKPTSKKTAEAADRMQPRSIVTITSASDGPMHTVRFGDVTVTARRPSDAEVQHSIDSSTLALGRALKSLLKPGVRIRPKKDVPLYSAAPDAENVFIRLLNGKRDRGILKNGQFMVID